MRAVFVISCGKTCFYSLLFRTVVVNQVNPNPISGFRMFSGGKEWEHWLEMVNSSVIRQKGESQKGVTRRQSTSNFLKKEYFSSGGKNVRFSENLARFVFLLSPF